jgi:D-3-phosphoglycerate dehydrogenase / 2-oxoglutarate reductase
MSTTPRVVIADRLSPAALDIFRSRGLEPIVATADGPSRLPQALARADALVVRSATRVTAELLAAAPRLRVVGRAGIGVDTIDVRAATARGVVVMNTPHGNAITTAEHAIGLIFALARQLPEASASTKAGRWEKNRFMGMELAGKTLGLIGVGNVGSIVADRALALRLRVLACDPFLSETRAMALGIEKVELPEILARADIITLHTPLTEATRNLLSREAIARCRPGVRIVNCARGGLIDEAALHDAILAGHVAGAALDVFESEPATASPLFALDRVVCTPHIGASTAEAQEKVAIQIAEQISDFLLHGAIANAVNAPSVPAEDAPRLRPALELARLLGSLAGQLAAERGAIGRVAITFEGAAPSPHPVTAAALWGLLSPRIAGLNLVNAPLAAREHGIEIDESVLDRMDTSARLRMIVEDHAGSLDVAGTLAAGETPRIAAIGGVAMEAGFDRHMLHVESEDAPGFLGRFGAVLAGQGLSVAALQMGRAASGREAMCLASLDQPAGQNAIAALRGTAGVRAATALAF